jgi:hypothetical protein
LFLIFGDNSAQDQLAALKKSYDEEVAALIAAIFAEPNDKNRPVFRPASLSSLPGTKPACVVCLAGQKTFSLFIYRVRQILHKKYNLDGEGVTNSNTDTAVIGGEATPPAVPQTPLNTGSKATYNSLSSVLSTTATLITANLGAYPGGNLQNLQKSVPNSISSLYKNNTVSYNGNISADAANGVDKYAHIQHKRR